MLRDYTGPIEMNDKSFDGTQSPTRAVKKVKNVKKRFVIW